MLLLRWLDYSGSDFERSYNGTGNSTIDILEFNSDITTDFSFYLNRIDKLFITREGELKIVKGASSLNPLAPQNLDGHLHLNNFRNTIIYFKHEQMLKL